jgi:hypothetical protein
MDFEDPLPSLIRLNLVSLEPYQRIVFAPRLATYNAARRMTRWTVRLAGITGWFCVPAQESRLHCRLAAFFASGDGHNASVGGFYTTLPVALNTG